MSLGLSGVSLNIHSKVSISENIESISYIALKHWIFEYVTRKQLL